MTTNSVDTEVWKKDCTICERRKPVAPLNKTVLFNVKTLCLTGNIDYFLQGYN